MAGRPPIPRRLKILNGTLQPSRDAEEVLPLPASEALPPAPEWLPNAHALREYERLGAAMLSFGLLHEGNLGALIMLCAVHGNLVQLLLAGRGVQASLVSQYRGLAADLRLTSLVRIPTAGDATKPNKFANNGRRPDNAAGPAPRSNNGRRPDAGTTPKGQQ